MLDGALSFPFTNAPPFDETGGELVAAAAARAGGGGSSRNDTSASGSFFDAIGFAGTVDLDAEAPDAVDLAALTEVLFAAVLVALAAVEAVADFVALETDDDTPLVAESTVDLTPASSFWTAFLMSLTPAVRSSSPESSLVIFRMSRKNFPT
jgi:hypothetical protein